MNNDFSKKLEQYKKGQLNEDDASLVQEEIDRISAVMNYLEEDDDAVWTELKNNISEENEPVLPNETGIKNLINRRIIFTTVRVVILIWIAIVILTIGVGGLISKIFALNYEEIFVEQSTINQIIEMFLPDYQTGDTFSTGNFFSRQEITTLVDRTVGFTTLDSKEISIEYLFGKPRTSDSVDNLFVYQRVEDFSSYLKSAEGNVDAGFTALENAPSGTTAKVLVLFNNPMSPEQLKSEFIDKLFSEGQDPIPVTPIVVTENQYIVANPSYYTYTPVYPFGDDQQDVMKDRGSLESLFRSYDNQAHTDSMIGNLEMLKNNEALLKVLVYPSLPPDMDIDNAILEIEEDGVKYYGAYFTADTKDILDLKGNPLINSIQVDSIVVW